MFSDSRSTSILNAGAKSYKVAVETVESVQMVQFGGAACTARRGTRVRGHGTALGYNLMAIHTALYTLLACTLVPC